MVIEKSPKGGRRQRSGQPLRRRDVAVKLKVRVDVEVLVDDPVTTARGAVFYTS
jgi:hypothetical protein